MFLKSEVVFKTLLFLGHFHISIQRFTFGYVLNAPKFTFPAEIVRVGSICKMCNKNKKNCKFWK